MEKGEPLQQMVQGKLKELIQSKEIEPLSNTTHENYLERNQILKHKTIIKLQKENVEKKLIDISLGDVFLNIMQKVHNKKIWKQPIS